MKTNKVMLCDTEFVVRCCGEESVEDDYCVGTSGFRAPECRSSKRGFLYSKKSDVYSVGKTILWFLEEQQMESLRLKDLGAKFCSDDPAQRPSLLICN